MAAGYVLAHLSDTHIRAANAGDGFDTNANLAAALAALKPYRPDLILITGDLANDARADEYAALAALLRAAPAPVRLMCGNHDEPDLIRAAFPDHAYLPPHGPLRYAHEAGPVRLVALDTLISGDTGGALGTEDEAFLRGALRDGRPAVVALHHPPFASQDALFDTMNLRDATRFESVIAAHPHVGLILCGHHHRAIQARVAHAPAICAPATAWGYDLALRGDQKPAQKRAEEIGFALHVWPHAGGPPLSHFVFFQPPRRA